MKKFDRLVGIGAPLREANIDTDQILPKQFLKVVKRKGLARALFYDLRFDSAGNPQDGFVLTRAPYDKATILIAGENFACGSSREHAVWALVDFGIRCVIAPSFGEIFFNNSFNNGLLPIVVSQEANARLLEEARAAMPLFTIDLAAQIIAGPSELVVDFQLDPTRKRKLMLGLDEMAETLAHLADIEAFEASRTRPGKALISSDE